MVIYITRIIIIIQEPKALLYLLGSLQYVVRQLPKGV